jgi:hypothetical protein
MRRRLIKAKMNNNEVRVWKHLEWAVQDAVLLGGVTGDRVPGAQGLPEALVLGRGLVAGHRGAVRRSPAEDERPRDWPRTTAGLERRLQKIKDWLDPRAESFKNRERMDCLLHLMQLEVNGEANQNAYTRAIHTCLPVAAASPAPGAPLPTSRTPTLCAGGGRRSGAAGCATGRDGLAWACRC